MLQIFIQNLIDGDQIRVGDPQPITEDEKRCAATLLAEFEQQYRLVLPGEPPDFDIKAAVWSAVSFYTAASLVVHRDQGQEVIDVLLDSASPERTKAATHYSVDLTMRFLPDLLKLAKSAATDDPLVMWRMDWARAWPLSSVGIEIGGQCVATPLRTSPMLMRLYADRVIASGDRSRLDDPALVEVVRAAIGNYPDLCPQLARIVNKT